MNYLELGFSILAVLVVVLAVLQYLNAKKASDTYPSDTPNFVKELLTLAVTVSAKTKSPWDDIISKAGLDVANLEVVVSADGSITLREKSVVTATVDPAKAVG